MSSREKRLLILFLSAIFLMANVFGFKWLQSKRNELGSSIAAARGTLSTAETVALQQESAREEFQWFQKHLPESMEGDLVPSRLQTEVSGLATRAGLTVTRPSIEPTIPGNHFNRAQFQINVSGNEQALYRWLVQVHSPKDFRAVTALRLSPNREDDTLIDAAVTVEQWFVPKGMEVPN